MPTQTGPLAGIRVLDLTTVQMGPWCTRILGDLGADILKVEALAGDSNRYTGVPKNRGMSGTFQHNARGKRSIALDLKQKEALEAVRKLIPTVDAFASNIRPAALKRLGLDYESIKAINPGIANGNQTAPFTNLYVNFLDLPRFDSFRLTSPQYAFELDNIAVGRVPENLPCPSHSLELFPCLVVPSRLMAWIFLPSV